MLFDDVMLHLNDDVCGVEGGATAVRAALRTQRVLLGLEM
jgi:hypothetical protein